MSFHQMHPDRPKRLSWWSVRWRRRCSCLIVSSVSKSVNLGRFRASTLDFCNFARCCLFWWSLLAKNLSSWIILCSLLGSGYLSKLVVSVGCISLHFQFETHSVKIHLGIHFRMNCILLCSEKLVVIWF